MNKLLITAALLSTCGATFAQSSVTMYGLVDAGVVYDNSRAAGSVTKIESGIESGSRLGVKGNIDLGNGLSALFVLEQGMSIDTGASTQAGRVFGRQALVGLKGDFGTVTLGRQYTPIYNAYGVIDPFGNNTAGDINTLFGQDADFLSRDFRMDNAIVYTSHTIPQGFNMSFAYGFGEQAGDLAKQRQIGLSIGYIRGPLYAVYAYHQANNENLEFDADAVPGLINYGTYKSHFLGAVYDFGGFKVHAALDQTKQGDSFKTQSYLLGATIPLGKHAVFGDVIYRDNKITDDANATQVAIGYNHTLSNRTNLYSILAHTRNEANSKANTDVGGKSGTRIQLGIKHIF